MKDEEQKQEKVDRRLVIVPIGDIFRERYYVPTIVGDAESEITYPEALRGKLAVRSTTIPSGSILHANVLKEIVDTADLPEGIPNSCRPSVSVWREKWHENLRSEDWALFNTYLHELGAFPSKETTRGNEDRVWRIKETKGFSEEDDDITDRAERRRQAGDRLDKQLAFAADAVKKLRKNDSLLLVVNDRNHIFRARTDALGTLFDELNSYIKRTSSDNVLIVWHVRKPDQHNAFAKAVGESELRHHVIAVVNQECLRDQGVNLRFDISYEHSLQDFIQFSEQNRLLKHILWFPQTLIRFDYGVLHIGTDLPAESDHEGTWAEPPVPRISSVDVHGMIGGPFYIASPQYGMITGRTFLLVASLVREIVRWFYQAPFARLVDVVRMEGIFNRFRQPRPPYLQPPLGECGVPSILRNSLIDQSIDLGILLSARHFYGGFGDFETGVLPSGVLQGKVAHHFKTLIQECEDRFIARKDRDFKTGSQIAQMRIEGKVVPFNTSEIINRFEFRFDHDEPKLTRLTRFSVPLELVRNNDEASERRRHYSRVDSLRNQQLMSLVVEQEGAVPEKKAFTRTLTRIVTGGIDSVLCRKPHAGGFFDEPSIVAPYVHFRDRLLVLDRDEIDSYLSIRILFENYLATSKAGSKPLSIGVFGPPGSGKSFAVKEIIRAVGKSPDADSMTFNLSQFTSIDELSRSFHKIQDRALARQVPVAFFDEFDSTLKTQPLGWLKLFLAPMQDGEFFDGQETFHVGPAIFVFCGGTTDSFDNFRTDNKNNKTAKVPDFVSRLRGHLTIRDISAIDDQPVDDRLKVRRAVLLRSLLRNKLESQIFDETGKIARIDPAIVAAFLNVRKFEHGARSMEAIIEMARVGDSGGFQKSSLPPILQLNMHVSGREFMDLVNRDWEAEQ